MTLAEERELEVVRSGLTYALVDDHSERPHWHARYPWVEDPATLPNNRKAVERQRDSWPKSWNGKPLTPLKSTTW